MEQLKRDRGQREGDGMQQRATSGIKLQGHCSEDNIASAYGAPALPTELSNALDFYLF